MSYELFIGLRHLRSKKRNRFLSIITLISVAGVSFGVITLVVVLSVMSGFERDLTSKILGTNAHIVVVKSASGFSRYPWATDEIRQVKGVTAATPFILNEVMISSQANMAGVMLKGIIPEEVTKVTDLGRNLEHGSLRLLEHPEEILSSLILSPPLKTVGRVDGGLEGADRPQRVSPDGGAPAVDGGVQGVDGEAEGVPPPRRRPVPGIVVGRELARSLRLYLGDDVTVVSPMGDLGPSGPMPKSRLFRVAAIFYSGMYEYDSKFVYVTLAEAQRFFNMDGEVTGVEVKVKNIYDTKDIASQIVSRLHGYPYRTKDWMEMNRNLFSALRLEKITMFIILTFIVLVASFNIVSTLIMLVIEKAKEIAILKSMGASSRGIMKIFMIEGLIIGVVGTAIGILVGLALCVFIREYGIGLDPEVYYIHDLPVEISLREIAIVALSAIIISFLATIYPSFQAARLRPVEGLRYE